METDLRASFKPEQVDVNRSYLEGNAMQYMGFTANEPRHAKKKKTLVLSFNNYVPPSTHTQTHKLPVETQALPSPGGAVALHLC